MLRNIKFRIQGRDGDPRRCSSKKPCAQGQICLFSPILMTDICCTSGNLKTFRNLFFRITFSAESNSMWRLFRRFSSSQSFLSWGRGLWNDIRVSGAISLCPWALCLSSSPRSMEKNVSYVFFNFELLKNTSLDYAASLSICGLLAHPSIIFHCNSLVKVISAENISLQALAVPPTTVTLTESASERVWSLKNSTGPKCLKWNIYC